MTNKIEIIVRHYVKKFIAEALTDLDALVERKVATRLDSLSVLREVVGSPAPTRNLQETLAGEVPSSNTAPTAPRRKLTPEDLGVSPEMWEAVYSDTAASDSPILSEVRDYSEDQPSAERPETAPEEAMVAAGLMRDYSKHMTAFAKKDKQVLGDVDLELQRREILNKTIR